MKLTFAQYNTIKEAKRIAEETGLAVTHYTLVKAHRIGYSKLAGADGRTVAAYVAGNLKSAGFRKALEPFAVETDHKDW